MTSGAPVSSKFAVLQKRETAVAFGSKWVCGGYLIGRTNGAEYPALRAR